MKTLNLIVVLSLILVGCKGDSSKESAKAEKERLEKARRATAKKVTELCSQHNAVMDWPQSLEGVWRPFTIELESALIRADGRPVLFLGEIKDVTKKTDSYSVLFEFYDSVFYDFVLDCAPEQVKEIMNHRESIGPLPEFAVIARVTDVKKVSNLYSVYDEVTLDFASNHFIATGTCQDIEFLGDSGLSFWELNDLLSNK